MGKEEDISETKTFFTKGSGHSKKLRAGRIATTAIGSIFALSTAYSALYVNQAREVSLEVTFGKVTEQVDTAGLKFKKPFISTRFPYTLTRQSIEIDEDTKLRTGDDIRLTAGFTVDFQIEEGADIEKLYLDLKGQGGDLVDVVNVRAKDSATRALEALTIEDLVPPAKTEAEELATEGQPETGFTDMMTTGIKERLQAEFVEQGWPVEVLDVYSKGFQFDSASESKLAEIVRIRQEKVKLVLRQENAVKAAEVYAAEAGADAAYLNVLRDAGLTSPTALAQAFCLKTARDAGNINDAFTPGCIGGDSGVAVAVDPKTGPKVPVAE
jgi:regulator of protease activity HflC (stomatin/prohibitin superfamily)